MNDLTMDEIQIVLRLLNFGAKKLEDFMTLDERRDLRRAEQKLSQAWTTQHNESTLEKVKREFE